MTRSFEGLRLLGAMSIFGTLAFDGGAGPAALARFVSRPVTEEDRKDPDLVPTLGAFLVRETGAAFLISVLGRGTENDDLFLRFRTKADTLVTASAVNPENLDEATSLSSSLR